MSVAEREWLTVNETAAEVGIHPKTVRDALERRPEEIRHRRMGSGEKRAWKVQVHTEGVDRLRELYPRDR